MSWLSTRRGDPRFLLVRYQDLQTQPLEEMAKIAAFLGIAANQERLAFAIKQSAADRLREMEKKQGTCFPRRVRRGRTCRTYAAKSGGRKRQLSEASVAQIESAWGGLMRELGYELALPTLAHADVASVAIGVSADAKPD